MFGGDPSSSCSSCGKEKCSCNCDCHLSEHLKKSDGLGNLPPLIDKCDDVPGPELRDRCPKSTCANNDDCSACGKFTPPKADCTSKAPPCPEEKKCEKPKCEEKLKCPFPMPVKDCEDCKPAMVSCPSPLTKAYPTPEGEEILPISTGGWNGQKIESNFDLIERAHSAHSSSSIKVNPSFKAMHDFGTNCEVLLPNSEIDVDENELVMSSKNNEAQNPRSNSTVAVAQRASDHSIHIRSAIPKIIPSSYAKKGLRARCPSEPPHSKTQSIVVAKPSQSSSSVRSSRSHHDGDKAEFISPDNDADSNPEFTKIKPVEDVKNKESFQDASNLTNEIPIILTSSNEEDEQDLENYIDSALEIPCEKPKETNVFGSSEKLMHIIHESTTEKVDSCLNALDSLCNAVDTLLANPPRATDQNRSLLSQLDEKSSVERASSVIIQNKTFEKALLMMTGLSFRDCHGVPVPNMLSQDDIQENENNSALMVKAAQEDMPVQEKQDETHVNLSLDEILNPQIEVALSNVEITSEVESIQHEYAHDTQVIERSETQLPSVASKEFQERNKAINEADSQISDLVSQLLQNTNDNIVTNNVNTLGNQNELESFVIQKSKKPLPCIIKSSNSQHRFKLTSGKPTTFGNSSKLLLPQVSPSPKLISSTKKVPGIPQSRQIEQGRTSKSKTSTSIQKKGVRGSGSKPNTSFKKQGPYSLPLPQQIRIDAKVNYMKQQQKQDIPYSTLQRSTSYCVAANQKKKPEIIPSPENPFLSLKPEAIKEMQRQGRRPLTRSASFAYHLRAKETFYEVHAASVMTQTSCQRNPIDNFDDRDGGSRRKCGQDKGPLGKSKVSANCLMMKPRGFGSEKEEIGTGSIFDKIKYFFGGSKKRETYPLGRTG